MEAIVPSVLFVSLIILFGVDAKRKRSEFLKKQKQA